mgnify:CR=1 FL=1
MIGLIDYGAGNTASVENVLKQLNVSYKIIKTEYDTLQCEKIILPGVGEAKYAMKRLAMNNLVNFLRIIKKPILGICLGMQLFCKKSEESETACLGIVDCDVIKFSHELKIPHMGWNAVKFIGESKLLTGIPDNSYFYFAHSYYLPILDSTKGTTEYSLRFSSVIEKDNYYGVQFHPEKSGEYGIKLIKNFLELC